jgi:Ca-activated chloride channel family protein
MTDKLDLLAALQAPPADSNARRKAIEVALAQFDAAQKNPAAAQGSGFIRRLMSGALQNRSTKMTTRTILAGPAFATLLLAPVIGLVAYQQFAGGDHVAERPEAEEQRPPRVDQFADLNRDGESRDGDNAPPVDGRSRLLAGKLIEAAEAPKSKQSGYIAMQGAADATVSAESGIVAAPAPHDRNFEPAPNRDRVEKFSGNPVKRVADEPVSTFSVDVDTASYAQVRRALNNGRLPDPETVRVEELINYFPYAYTGPQSAAEPFRANVTVMPTPWNQHTLLMHVGVKGYEIAQALRPKSNLVFLIDTSGSMQDADKLPLVKASLKLLLDRLDAGDTVGIVTYAGSAGVALEATQVADKAKILAAIERLGASGSTAGAAGIEEAYRLAEKAFVKGGVNRVLLATDGDFNVGMADDASLKRLIEGKRKGGVFLSVLGFGQGNYNDQLMQALAQNGNGVAAYIDTLAEAEKTLAQEAAASLFPIAKDVKIQVEFNPARISEYRLIGYETRALKREDFNNDRVDAGDIGSGHTVTAIYEMTPKGSPAELIGALRYGDSKAAAGDASGEFAFVRIRHKRPDSDTSELQSAPVTDVNLMAEAGDAAEDVRFSVAVAAFGQKLRDADALAGFGWEAISDLAAKAKGADAFGYRAEFLRLVRLAKGLAGN